MRTLIGTALAAVLVGFGFYFSPIKSPATQPGDTSSPTPQTVTFRVLDAGVLATNFSTKKNYAVYTAEDFAKMWKMVHGSARAPLPTIDFTKEYVIGVFAGQKPTGGYSVAVAAVTDAANVRTVAITLTKPGANCVETQTLTNPYELIAVPISGARLTHTDNETTTPCK